MTWKELRWFLKDDWFVIHKCCIFLQRFQLSLEGRQQSIYPIHHLSFISIWSHLCLDGIKQFWRLEWVQLISVQFSHHNYSTHSRDRSSLYSITHTLISFSHNHTHSYSPHTLHIQILALSNIAHLQYLPCTSLQLNITNLRFHRLRQTRWESFSSQLIITSSFHSSQYQEANTHTSDSRVAV